MDPDDALTASAQLHNPCRDTTEGWLWYCDEHDTHGNADSRDEAQYVASFHREFHAQNSGTDDCDIVITKVEP